MTSLQRNKSVRTPIKPPLNHSSFPRSISPSGRFCSSTISSTISNFSSTRSTSPTRITVRGGYVTSSPTVRFSIDRTVASTSSSNSKVSWSHGSKKTCLCSPTTHPGSFRCSLHKNVRVGNGNGRGDSTVAYRSHRLYARRSAMTNSLVRIGTVEGDLVKRALAALIRPSSHQQRRRSDFQPRLSRLSVMSKADD